MDVYKKEERVFEDEALRLESEQDPETSATDEDELGSEELDEVSGGRRRYYSCPRCGFKTTSRAAMDGHRASTGH